MTLVQKVIPLCEYANMKIPALIVHSFTLMRHPKERGKYYPLEDVVMEVSSRWSDFCVLLEDGTKNRNIVDFSIDLKQVKYGVDQSQFIYLKNHSQGIKMCGKLKIIVSDSEIPDSALKEVTTV